jgi:hypothetical protein
MNNFIISEFPSSDELPPLIAGLEGNCGPASLWLVLKYFGVKVSSARLLRLCRYTKKHGTFMIYVAVALRSLGVNVRFYSQPDTAQCLLERQGYKSAMRMGIPVLPALSLPRLVQKVKEGDLAIVFYDSRLGIGHISPLVAVRGTLMVVPYDDDGIISLRDFAKRWSADGICRQCVVIRQKSSVST